MAEVRFNVICPTCKKTRDVSRTMLHFIKTGKNTGNCKSCSLKGNKYRYNIVYDKKLYNSPIYKSWSNMLNRCNNKNDKRYSDWGGRGIKVCKEWKIFPNFYKDMSSTFKLGLTLDRINNNGNYCKENCHWATRKEQALNTRNIERAIHITFNGVTKTISEWAEEIGIKKTTLYMRIKNYKLPLEMALTKGGQIGRF